MPCAVRQATRNVSVELFIASLVVTGYNELCRGRTECCYGECRVGVSCTMYILVALEVTSNGDELVIRWKYVDARRWGDSFPHVLGARKCGVIIMP